MAVTKGFDRANLMLYVVNSIYSFSCTQTKQNMHSFMIHDKYVLNS